MKSGNKRVFIGCSSRDSIDIKYLDLTDAVSKLLISKDYDLVFGASSSGMMGRCYKSFLNGNKKIYSYTVTKYIDDLKNIESSEEYLLKTTFMRTENMYEEASILVFLPGGTGTISEIFSVLEENRSIDKPKKVILYNYDGFYDKVLDLINYCVINNFNDKTIFDYFMVVNNNDELLKELESINKLKK